ncbi:hypothetical protein HG530_000009 [Fusarium avenaceum]|nr:hypothetical protein HG530_000009 [Fusarium avenaceum]
MGFELTVACITVAGNELALCAVNHVEKITRDDLAVLLDKALDRVVNLTSKVLYSEASRSVLSHEVATSSNANLLGLEHVGLAVEEVLESQVVDALSSSVVEQLVERRASGGLLAETGEIHNGNSVSNGLLGGTKTLVDGLKDPSDKKRVQCSCQLASMSTSAVGVEHNCDTLPMNHLRLVTQSSLQVGSAHAEESGNNAKNILVLNRSDGGTTLVGETTTVVASSTGLTGRLELELANVKNTGENLADLSNFSTRKL